MKRLSSLLLLLFLCLHTLPSSALNPPSTWNQATRLYQGQQYDSAAMLWEQIAAQPGFRNAALFYNLGNTYYKLNNIGHAVLNYERALFRNPADKMSADNLSLCQSRITNRIRQNEDIFFLQWWHTLTRADHADLWAILALITTLLLALLLVARRTGKLPVRLPVQTYFIISTLLLLQLLMAYIAAGHKAHTDKAVVMENNTPFTAAPAVSKGQSLIPEGTTVTITGQAKGWVQAELPDGRSGWMQREAVIFVQAD